MSKTDEKEIDLASIFQTIMDSWRIIGLSAAAAAVLGGLYGFSSTPIYRADALLQLESKGGAPGMNSSMAALLGGGGDASTVAEIEIMKSRLVLDRAVQELRLDIKANPKPLGRIGRLLRVAGVRDGWVLGLGDRAWSGDEQIVVSDYFIAGARAADPVTVTATEDGGFTVELPDGRELTGKVGTPLTDAEAEFRILITQLDGKPGRAFEVSLVEPSRATEDLRKRIAVSEAVRQSNILKIVITDSDPRRAERILDGLARAYVDQNIERSAAEAAKSLEFVSERIPEAERKLTEAQNALNAYMAKNQAVDIRYETQSLLERAAEIEAQLGKIRLDEEVMKGRFTLSHPQYQMLLKSRDALEVQLNELKTTAASLPETQKEVFNLMRQQDVAQEIYMQLQTRSQELQVMKASSIGSVRIIDTARATEGPVEPRKPLILVLSAILGLMGSIAFVLIRRALHKGVRTSDEIEKLGLAVFATVNQAPEQAIADKAKGKQPILAASHPESLTIEALRSLRTALHFGMMDAQNNALAITSSAPGSGKSFVSVNLAMVAAEAGQRVCLIDADMRRGHLRRYFNSAKDADGLAQVLAGTRTASAALVKTDNPGLSFLPTGKLPPNPSELLLRPSLGQLLGELQADFDLVLLDCPPVLAVTDPVILSKAAGTTLLVVRHMMTPLAEVEASIAHMSAAGCKINGAILNGFDLRALGSSESKAAYSYRYDYRKRD